MVILSSWLSRDIRKHIFKIRMWWISQPKPADLLVFIKSLCLFCTFICKVDIYWKCLLQSGTRKIVNLFFVIIINSWHWCFLMLIFILACLRTVAYFWMSWEKFCINEKAKGKFGWNWPCRSYTIWLITWQTEFNFF